MNGRREAQSHQPNQKKIWSLPQTSTWEILDFCGHFSQQEMLVLLSSIRSEKVQMGDQGRLYLN